MKQIVLVPLGILVPMPWARRSSLLANNVCQVHLDLSLALGPVRWQYSRESPVVESTTEKAVAWDWVNYLGIVFSGGPGGRVLLLESLLELSLGITCGALGFRAGGWDIWVVMCMGTLGALCGWDLFVGLGLGFVDTLWVGVGGAVDGRALVNS